MKKLRKYFFQGLLFLVPIGLTIYIVYQIYIFINGLLITYIRPIIHVNIPFLDLLIVLAVIALVGLLGGTFIFRPVKNLVNKAFMKIPLINLLFTSLKDILSAFVGKERKFSNPALVKINHLTNLEKLGFITQEDLSKIGVRDKKVAVYFPHSYNFSGELFIVPAKQVTPLDLPSSEVMKFIVSGGVIDIEAKKID
ncbi:MAG: DUF502 domain-containing protein [Bacteroidota bacterium]|nr:DUF502 domain-containing protein [Bacteroidota bacterium]